MKSLTKSLQKALSYLASPMTVGLLFTGFMVWVSVRYYASQHSLERVEGNTLVGVLDQIHRKSIDFRLINRGEIPGSPRVAILAVDEESIEREGRWPWPREKIGKLIENAVDAGARVVAFDMVFSETDQNSSGRTLSILKQNLKRTNLLSEQTETLIDKEIVSSNSDKKMADVIGLYKDSAVMGTYFNDESLALSIQNPLRDYCIDAHYARTAESRYWAKEKILPIIEDSASKAAAPLIELLPRVGSYITSREVQAAGQWVSRNTSAAEAVLTALREDAELSFSLEDLAPTLAFSLLGDIDGLATVLEQKPEWQKYLNKPMMLQIFQIIHRALGGANLSSLRGALDEEGDRYCSHFLTAKDELLHRELFLKDVELPPEVVAAAWEEQGLPPAWTALQQKSPELAGLPLEKAVQQWRSQALLNPIVGFSRSWINIPEFAAATDHTGYFQAELDPDGTIRRTRLLARRGNTYVPSLSLKAFLLDRGYTVRVKLEPEPVGRADLRRKVVSKFEFLDKEGEPRFSVPVDEEARLFINYSGPQRMFSYISAASLLNADDKLSVSQWATDPGSGKKGFLIRTVDRKEFLKDKLLIVGATAIGVYDLRLTPFEENYPGVETHANVLSNLVVEDLKHNPETAAAATTLPGFLRIHPQEESAMWLILLVVGVVLSALLTWLGSLAGLLVTLSTVFAIYAIDRHILFASGYIVNVSLPLISTFAIFVGITFYKYFTEERKKQELKGTFAKYVSPAVVDEILKDPGNIELGGKKMELTVMFSDVRGFTTISEKLDPRALSDLLNSYLTPMTDLVFAHKGTLDKYMGDAIMAFWGAPIHFDDHANKAAACALQMLVKLKELQADYAAKGLPSIDIGIGLNTGDMSVGNMGSNTVRSYTVMGDSVNLGSRLEGINKEYGTRIIVSEFTEKKIAADYVLREVDWVRVKGKAQPVRIFELIGAKAGELKAPDAMLALLPDFQAGFNLYHERKFQEAIDAFTRALGAKPDDECSQLYIERCQDYLKEPPPSEWDGVYTMKTK